MRTMLALMILSVAAPALAAAPGSPQDTLEQGVGRLRTALKNGGQRSELAGTFAGLFDFDELAKQSLGSDWAKQSKADQEKFAKLLRAVIEANYLPKLKDAPSDFGFNVQSDKTDSGVAIVKVLATGKTAKLPLDFRLHQANGKWLVFDTVIDGVGLVETYQEQFSRMMAKSGFPGVLRALESKKAALEKEQAAP